MTQAAPKEVDVCLVVEGCYPFITGGVSTWLDWLIRTQPDRTFGVVALVADESEREVMFELPDNLAFLQIVALDQKLEKPGFRAARLDRERLEKDVFGLLRGADMDCFASLVRTISEPCKRKFLSGLAPVAVTRSDLLSSFTTWEVMVSCYERLAPHSSFVDFFWAWRNLMGGLFSVLCAPTPPARSYHAISTGYAGLFAAAAAARTSRPAIITEHGIYTNERRIDLIMAEWISDMIDRGVTGIDDRMDVRDFWINAFSSFARVTYGYATKITTLYGENQLFQKALGATEQKLEVIPNGIDFARFASLRRDRQKRPTVGMIGRVVPIKDVEAFIASAAIVRRRYPDVEFLILGPTTEDAEYFEVCKQKVEDLGLRNTVKFLGQVDITAYLPRIDVLVLTSISEAQPLVLLEAGAAGVPCVATDVGSCREIIEGPEGEEPAIGAGGIIVPPMNTPAIAEAVLRFIGDDDLRSQCGARLRQRVERHFTSEASSGRYADLYASVVAA